MKKVIMFFIGVIFQISNWAQAPQAFNYQAVLRDASGNVKPNAEAEVQIDLLIGTEMGSTIYSEWFSVLTNAFGLINLQIGNGSVISGSFYDINWGEGPYFIRVSVDGDEMGTSQLFSVPYALYAANQFSGNYVDLSGRPDLSDTSNYLKEETDPLFNTSIASSISASDTARWNVVGNFSGNYNDLINKPELFDGTWNSLTGKPTFSAVATSGNYNDLTNKPELFNGTWSSLTGKPIFSTVATSGSYTDLSNRPDLSDTSVYLKTELDPAFNLSVAKSIKSSDTARWSAKSNFSGNYNDLTNKPTMLDSVFNSSTGNSSFHSNISGIANTAYGYYTLYSNTTGFHNTAIGVIALSTNSTGYRNTAIGSNVLSANTIGNYNTATGIGALNSNTTGSYNTANGASALQANLTGHSNTANGMSASSVKYNWLL